MEINNEKIQSASKTLKTLNSNSMSEQINIIHQFLDDLVCHHSQFRPGKHFYEKTGIGSKRFGAIYRAKKSPTLQELQAIAEYFGMHISVITDKRQTKLFNDDVHV